MTPVLCPICTRSNLEPLFQEFTIKAEINGERQVGGLVAYRCLEFSHVFFVRKVDMEADPELRYAV